MTIILLSSVPFNRARGNSVYSQSLTNEIKKNKKVFLIQPSFENNEIINDKHLTIINIKVSSKFKQKDRIFYQNVENTIKKIKKDFNISLIHILYGHYFKIFIKELGPKLVWTCHNVPPNEYNFQGIKNIPVIKFFLKSIIFIYHLILILISNYDLIILNSKRVEKIFKFFKPFFPKMLVIGCGHNFKNNQISEKKNNKTEIKLLTIASFKPHKNMEKVLEIAKKLEINKIKYVWTILADNYNTDYKKKIFKIKKKNNIKKVKFLKKISEEKKNNLYIRSDIYVQTSSEEGFCIPFLEASCFSHLLVLGTPTGAMPEISKFFNCHICHYIDDFFLKIQSRVDNKIKFRNVSQKQVLKWSWSNIAKKTVQAYKKV